MQLIFFILFMILQTTILPGFLEIVRPDLILILLILSVSAKGLTRGFFWGVLFGLFMDIFMGIHFYYLYIYSFLGVAVSIVPGDFFRDFKTLVGFNTIFATAILYLAVAAVQYLFFNINFFLPFSLFLLVCVQKLV